MQSIWLPRSQLTRLSNGGKERRERACQCLDTAVNLGLELLLIALDEVDDASSSILCLALECLLVLPKLGKHLLPADRCIVVGEVEHFTDTPLRGHDIFARDGQVRRCDLLRERTNLEWDHHLGINELLGDA
jgi:hypothetical protein